MISTRSAGLLIDTVVCLTLAKWETVSGRFGGYLTDVWRVGGKFGVCGRCGLLAGDSVGSIGTRKPQRDADWVTGGCCHQYGGMVGSYEVEGSRAANVTHLSYEEYLAEFPGYKPSSLRA